VIYLKFIEEHVYIHVIQLHEHHVHCNTTDLGFITGNGLPKALTVTVSMTSIVSTDNKLWIKSESFIYSDIYKMYN